MTVLEFESWVSEHYEDLLKASRAMAKQRGFSYTSAVDVVHQVVETTLEHPERLGDIAEDDRGPMVWPWMTARIRGYMTASRTASNNQHDAMERFAQEFSALGPDAFADMGHGSELAKARDARAKREKRQRPQGLSTAYEGVEVEWCEFPRDGRRWRRQQLRDELAFSRRWLSGRSSGAAVGTYIDGDPFRKLCNHNELHHAQDCQCGGVAFPAPVPHRRAG